MAQILLVDDQSSARLTLTALLKQNGHTLAQAATGADAITKIEKSDFDIIITDLQLGEISGLDILEASRKNNPRTEVIMLTGYGSVETAVAAMKAGAIDYLTKPIDTEELLLAISRAVERQRLKSEVKRLRSEVERDFDPGRIVSTSKAMSEVLDMVKKVAPTDAIVLIAGESGTGKELIARAIHQNSDRREEAFIPINCGALPESLLESELFGHIKGAFTGAIANKKGLFEEADGGTLFLDEIGEMTPPTQVKLLRVLQDGEVRRVGSNVGVSTDVRIVAATNQDLHENIKNGSFREDLYYRLQVILIAMPPLRERRDEIMPIANHYLNGFSQKFKKPVHTFSPSAVKALESHNWPGNVRELINAVERAVILCQKDQVEPDDLALHMNTLQNGISPSRSLEEVEREFLQIALDEHEGDAKATAKTVGMSMANFNKKLEEYEISK
ncbi:MAG: sigma-54 dependent transcriptional regulator [Abditibacteriaceae bacterium]